MADLPESATYPAGIYQLEQSDPVVGGAPNLATGDGMSNVQAQQLADRTNWLRSELLSRTAAAALLTSIKTVDGAGSGLDADLLDGRNLDLAVATPNTVAGRDGSGDMTARYMRATHGSATNIDPGASIFLRVNSTSDSYMRAVTAAGFVGWLNANRAGLDADKVDGLHASQFLRSDVPDSGGDISLNLVSANTAYIGRGNASGGGAVATFGHSGDRFWIAPVNSAGDGADFARELTVQPGRPWKAEGGLDTSGRLTISEGDANGNGLYGETGKRIASLESVTLRIGSGQEIIRFYASDINSMRVSVGGIDNILWHAGNDGAGSGLDADKVDGLHASQFMRSDAAAFTSGDLFVNGGNIHIDGQPGGDMRLYFRTEDDLRRALIYWNRGGDSLDFLRYNATGDTIAGRMSIASDGTVRINNSLAWHAGNDGAGSGLDADTVDDLQSWQFLRSDVDDTGTNLTLNSVYTNNFYMGKNGATGGGSVVAFGTSGNRFWMAPTNLNGGVEFGKELTFDPNGFGVWTAEAGFRTTGRFTAEAGDQNGVHSSDGRLITSQDSTLRIGAGHNIVRMYGGNSAAFKANYGSIDYSIWHDGTSPKSLAASGYQKLPSGLILQWRGGTANNEDLVTFPIAFPNACFGITFGDFNANNSGLTTDFLGYRDITKTNFVVTVRDANNQPSSGSTGYTFIAIGY